MTQYYINITEEQVELDAICVKVIGTGDNMDDVVCIVNNAQYQDLVDKLERATNETHEYIADEIKDVISDLTRGEYEIPYSETAGKLVLENGSDQEITYEELLSVIENADSVPQAIIDLRNLEQSIASLRTSVEQINTGNYYTKNEADTKITTVVNTAINKLYSKNDIDNMFKEYVKKTENTHTGWQTFEGTDSVYYINEDLHLGCYGIKHTFNTASGGVWYNWTSPFIRVKEKYRPKKTFFGSCHAYYGTENKNNDLGLLWINTDGYPGGQFAKGWTNQKQVSGTVWWFY